MIFRYGIELDNIHRYDKPITAVYRYGKLVWQAVHSSFGAGYWINAKGWDNKDGWKNNRK